MNLKKGLFERKPEPFRIQHHEDRASILLSTQLVGMLPDQHRPIVIVCIGTDRSTGDSLGPLIGTFLEEKKSFSFPIYGTLDEPVHAVNLEEKIEEINHTFNNPFIIGIDACLGRLKSVGSIHMDTGPVKPGAGVNKELPEVGNMHITGIVNVSGFMEFFVLQNTRLNIVMKMAKIISEAIIYSSHAYQRKYSLINLEREQKHIP
ncbi:spore protease YyaC [Rossellomorea sp. BNER]|uniref:spore protease YyaC n=1 Tax=Rossellomorea sp. BNER TaxID=2962031 RepID=UPI003AF26B8F|nr:spore protease YyaC [Rossellomorea sp. BNER]